MGYGDRDAPQPQPRPAAQGARRPPPRRSGQGPPQKRGGPRRTQSYDEAARKPPVSQRYVDEPETDPFAAAGVNNPALEEASEEATVIEDGYPQFSQPEPEPDPPPAGLQVVAGNDRGKNFILPRGTTVIGRGANCDLILADIAVSRRHALITFDGANYQLDDQGSGNGTKINGVRVRVQTLQPGDVVELGKTQLRFEWESAPAGVPQPQPAPAAHAAPAPQPMAQPAPQPVQAPVAQPAAGAPPSTPAIAAPAPAVPAEALEGHLTAQVAPLTPPAGTAQEAAPVEAAPPKQEGPSLIARLTDTKQKKIILMAGGGVIGLLLLLVIIGAFMGGKKSQKKAKTQAAKGPTPEKVFAQAAKHIQSKDWKSAAGLLKQLTAYDPKSEVYAKQARYVALNIKANEVIAKARQALQSGQLTKAQIRINDDFLKDSKFVKSGSCQVHPDACTLARAMARKVRIMKAAPLVTAARELAKSKKTREQAITKIKEALAIAPDSYAAQKVYHELGGPTPTAAPDPDLDKLAAAQTKPDGGPDALAPKGSGGGGGYGMPRSARSLYEARNFSGAAAEVDRAAQKGSGAAKKQLGKVAERLRLLARQIKNGNSSMHTDSAQAILQYRGALGTDQKLGGSHQGHIKSLLFKVTKARAGSLFSAGRYAASYRMVTMAQSYGGGPGLTRLLDQLSSKAKDIFNAGYIIRDSNTAKAKEQWRQVLTMVPASNKWAGKARFFLKRYGSGTTVAKAPPRRRPRRRRYTPRRRRYRPPPRRRRYRRPPPRRRRYRAPPRRRYVLGGDEDEDE